MSVKIDNNGYLIFYDGSSTTTIKWLAAFFTDNVKGKDTDYSEYFKLEDNTLYILEDCSDIFKQESVSATTTGLGAKFVIDSKLKEKKSEAKMDNRC